MIESDIIYLSSGFLLLVHNHTLSSRTTPCLISLTLNLPDHLLYLAITSGYTTHHLRPHPLAPFSERRHLTRSLDSSTSFLPLSTNNIDIDDQRITHSSGRSIRTSDFASRTSRASFAFPFFIYPPHLERPSILWTIVTSPLHHTPYFPSEKAGSRTSLFP